MSEGEGTTALDYGYSEGLADFRICPTCFHLYEAGDPDGENQRCTCQPSEETRSASRDFNEHAILCRCCALTVLPSGSRWHPFFCRECQLLAMGVSVWNRHLIFPIGRHSLMHTWATWPSTEPARQEPTDHIAGTYQALRYVARGSTGLWQWYAVIMERNLHHFGLSGDVSLREYMDAVAAEAPAVSTRLKAFDGLCQFFQADALDGTDRHEEQTV